MTSSTRLSEQVAAVGHACEALATQLLAVAFIGLALVVLPILWVVAKVARRHDRD